MHIDLKKWSPGLLLYLLMSTGKQIIKKKYMRGGRQGIGCEELAQFPHISSTGFPELISFFAMCLQRELCLSNNFSVGFHYMRSNVIVCP